MIYEIVNVSQFKISEKIEADRFVNHVEFQRTLFIRIHFDMIAIKSILYFIIILSYD